LNASRAVR